MAIDVNGTRSPLTVQLPAELITEIRTLAQEKLVSVDDVVVEACLGYTEPYLWQRTYKAWRKENPDEPMHEIGIDGDELLPSDPSTDP